MKAKSAPAKPSKAFVKEMQRMYPQGATITPAKKAPSKALAKAPMKSKK
jgi:hypothetical protein